LYRDAPPQTGDASDPGDADLVAYYPMSDSAADTSGNGYNGTVETGSSFTAGPEGYGRAVTLDGASGHVILPIGPLMPTLDSVTFAMWVNWSGAEGDWSRIFDFGTGTDVYTFLSPSGGGGIRFAITTGSSGAESQLSGPALGTDSWHHLAVTIDGATNEMVLYLDGSPVDSGTTETLPNDLGNTTQNWLGDSQYEADPYYNGSVDELRIYNRALTAGEVQYLVGDR
jgi:hypothetical protein